MAKTNRAAEPANTWQMPAPHEHLLSDLLDHVLAYTETRDSIRRSTDGPVLLEADGLETTLTEVKNLRESLANIHEISRSLIEMLAAILIPAPLQVSLTHKRPKLNPKVEDPAIGGHVTLNVHISDQPLDEDDQATIYTRVRFEMAGKTELEFPRLDRAREEE